jgi:hypothetical protein
MCDAILVGKKLDRIKNGAQCVPMSALLLLLTFCLHPARDFQSATSIFLEHTQKVAKYFARD